LIIRYLLPESAAYRPVVTKTSLSFWSTRTTNMTRDIGMISSITLITLM
jgi:hypothetical protein